MRCCVASEKFSFRNHIYLNETTPVNPDSLTIKNIYKLIIKTHNTVLKTENLEEIITNFKI